MKFEKGSKEWTAFTELWVLCQKYWNPQTDKEWEDFIHETDALAKKNKDIFTIRFYEQVVDSAAMRQKALSATKQSNTVKSSTEE